MSIRRWFRRLLSERRATSGRTPIYVGARLALDVVEVQGVARDVAPGGVFFATTAPIARGVRGRLQQAGRPEWVPVRVTGHRAASATSPAGLGLAFE